MSDSPGQWPDPYQQSAPSSSHAPVARPTNGLALASMIVSLAGIISCIGFPVGAILGHVALKQVRENNQEGETYAKVGIIVGWIGTGLGVLGCIGYFVFLFAFAAAIPTT